METVDVGAGALRLDADTSAYDVRNVTCPIALVHLTSLEFILPTVTLGILNVAVIVGNSLVIGAVFTSAKLRTTTNGFVCSLAVADLLVGLMVLPFSNANEVLRYWVFGHLWCRVWLAIDVWLCTASILNLVAISFDRYIAISKPFKYHNLLSPKKGKFLVGFVWILAFVICFPPLIGWNEQGKGIGNGFSGEETTGSGLGTTTVPLNTSVMETGRKSSPLSLGVVGTGSGDGSREDDTAQVDDHDNSSPYVVNVQEGYYSNLSYLFSQNVTVIEHKGQDVLQSCDRRYPECVLTADPGYIIYSALGSFWIPMVIMCAFYWKIYRTAVRSTAALKKGMLTTKSGNELANSNSQSVTLRVHRGGGGMIANDAKRRSGGTPASYSKYHYRSSVNRESDVDTVFINKHSNSAATRKKYRDPSRRPRRCRQGDVRLSSTGPQSDFPLLGKHPDDIPEFYALRHNKRKLRKHNSMTSGHSVDSITDEEHDLNGVDHGESKTTAFLRKARRKNIKMELMKLNKEKKAAKTVGIIVGCFVLCWLPFFTVYLLGAFCTTCTPSLLFSIFFWLGYCNSAINPCVYALFSRDFRSAFKKLLRCNCRVESRHKQQLGFVSKLHSFRLQNSSRSNDSNSD